MATHLPLKMALVLALMAVAGVQADVIYRLCTGPRVNLFNRCQSVSRGGSQVECVNVTDSVDCALKIQQGLADFGVFTAEEALLASNFIDKSVQVIADIRHVERLEDAYAFEAVAVVKNSFEGPLKNLKGAKFCHPGFAPGQLWTDAVLKHFERFVVSTPCEENLSVVEQEIKAVSNFFSSSCRPGPWALEDMFDDRLKLTYSNLCALCDSPKTCAYATHETGSHRAALTCLTHRGGDVAYVALRHVQQYFGLQRNTTPMASVSDYKFLCPNGSSVPLDSPTPCTWVQQPWSGVLARRDIAGSLQPLLLSWLGPSPDPRPPWQLALWGLTMEPDHVINNVSASLATYVRQIGGETKQACSGSVKWCTHSTPETRKCEWLRAAVQSHGIQPALDCVQASGPWECWAHVQDGSAHLVTLDTEYGYIARKSFNLSAVVYLDSGVQDNYHIMAVVSSASRISSWGQLMFQKACFPEFGGLAWVSVVSTLVEHRVLPKKCPYPEAMAGFFRSACAPGAKDPLHTRGSGYTPATLCSLCSTNFSDPCSTVADNVFYGDLGALRCLITGPADVAFIDYSQITESDGSLTAGLEPCDYRVLCRNGSLASTVGFNTDPSCALSRGVGSEVVARADRSQSRNLELIELLLQMDQWFGSNTPTKDSVFHMYSEFQGSKDLIFKDSTRSVILPNDVGYSQVNSYKSLQDINNVCDKKRNDAVSIIPSLIVLIAVFICPFVL